MANWKKTMMAAAGGGDFPEPATHIGRSYHTSAVTNYSAAAMHEFPSSFSNGWTFPYLHDNTINGSSTLHSSHSAYFDWTTKTLVTFHDDGGSGGNSAALYWDTSSTPRTPTFRAYEHETYSFQLSIGSQGTKTSANQQFCRTNNVGCFKATNKYAGFISTDWTNPKHLQIWTGYTDGSLGGNRGAVFDYQDELMFINTLDGGQPYNWGIDIVETPTQADVSAMSSIALRLVTNPQDAYELKKLGHITHPDHPNNHLLCFGCKPGSSILYCASPYSITGQSASADYLYLLMADYSNPSSISWTGGPQIQCNFNGGPTGFYIEEWEQLITLVQYNGYDIFHQLDISNPTSPTSLATYYFGTAGGSNISCDEGGKSIFWHGSYHTTNAKRVQLYKDGSYPTAYTISTAAGGGGGWVENYDAKDTSYPNISGGNSSWAACYY